MYSSIDQGLTYVSCRYFGHIYPRLLKIKNYWDPDNVINHCQSVGSTEQNCCIEEE